MFVGFLQVANLGSRMSFKGVELTAWRHIYFTLTHYLICLCSDQTRPWETERQTRSQTDDDFFISLLYFTKIIVSSQKHWSFILF